MWDDRAHAADLCAIGGLTCSTGSASTMSSYDVERDLFALGGQPLLDELERKRAQWREEWAADNTPTDEATRKHNARLRELEERHKAELAALLKGLSGVADEPAPTPDVRQGSQDASSPGEPATPGPIPAGPNNHAAELAEVERLKQLPMSAWAEERQRLIRASTSARGLFG
jgi:hypothetical protein